MYGYHGHHRHGESFCGLDLYGGVLSVNASLTGAPLRIHQPASCAAGRRWIIIFSPSLQEVAYFCQLSLQLVEEGARDGEASIDNGIKS